MQIPSDQQHSSLRTATPTDIVERWVQLQREMNQFKHISSSKSPTSFVVHSSANKSPFSHRLQSGSPYHQTQPVESLTVSFAKLLVNQINGASTATINKRRKRSKKPSSRYTNESVKTPIRNNQPVTQIDHVEDWLHQRSAHYAWWRKPTASSHYSKNATSFSRTCCNPTITKTLMVNHSQPHPVKTPRCILWFQFTGNPSKRPVSCNSKLTDLSVSRVHSIRIEQQPLGGANALVFAADLHIGEEFAIVSRRQPGFTFSLTFFIDGVRHARLSGCCENARNIHIPTRVGGPIGAFVLRTVQGGEHCQVCEKSAPFADPELFTVWPKSQPKHCLNSSQESDRSQELKQTRRRSSSQKRPKIIENSTVKKNTISDPSQDATVTYSSDFYDEQPSSDAIGHSLNSTDETCETYENPLDFVALPSEIKEKRFEPTKEILLARPRSTSVEEVDEDQSEFFPNNSVSIDEVVSVASSLRTPQSIPSSFYVKP